MALHATRTSGCSGCIIDAIVSHDERRLLDLLSNANVKFSDTYWIPRVSFLPLMGKFWYTLRSFRTTQTSQLSATAEQHCSHPVLAETLEAGKPANVAVSIALMSMLNTTDDFNALQVLVDSEKFDLSEPLVFHIPPGNCWSLVAVDPIGMAMLIDIHSDINNPNSFPLLKTLLRSSRLHLNSNADLRLMEMWLDDSGTAHWEAFRAHGALSFLYSYCRDLFIYFKWIRGISLSNRYYNKRQKLLLSLLKVLCRMGLTLNVDTPPTYCYRRNSSKHNYRETYIRSSTFLEALIDMFDIRFLYSRHEDKEWYVSEWLCNGWICAQKNEWTCLRVLASHSSDGNVYFRILRQLLSLGLFREADSEQFWSARCEGCSNEHQAALVTRRQCRLLIPLQDEFFRKPLSLLQLSRGEIRLLVGMNYFKERMETLQKMGLLPPSLFEYVWRANEMLADV